VQYGFRVPFLAISPYTKVGPSANSDGTISGGSISFTPYSHASLLRFVLDNWGLPANSLTPAVANAGDLRDMFDFQATPKGTLIRSTRTCTALSPAQRRLYKRDPWD